VRLVLLAGLAVVAIAVFAPNDGAGLMRSVLHGFGWGIVRWRITCSVIIAGDHRPAAALERLLDLAIIGRSERRSGRRPPKRTQPKRQFPASRAT
jgi:hypothetical protein